MSPFSPQLEGAGSGWEVFDVIPWEPGAGTGASVAGWALSSRLRELPP